MLQENVIFHLEAGATASTVVISSSEGYDDKPAEHLLPFERVVYPSDQEHFIHIVTSAEGLGVAAQMAAQPATLDDLGLQVSTGPVVDFRTKTNLRHKKMPDVVLHDVARDWLILIEAVTSHGPMNPKRVDELKQLFTAVRSGLVFVTAFPDVATFRQYSHDIAWETEVGSEKLQRI
ncbi:MAG: BsuBI/PstI family type II restriction endonuclease [Frankiaceae bacterium]